MKIKKQQNKEQDITCSGCRTELTYDPSDIFIKKEYYDSCTGDITIPNTSEETIEYIKDWLCIYEATKEEYELISKVLIEIDSYVHIFASFQEHVVYKSYIKCPVCRDNLLVNKVYHYPEIIFYSFSDKDKIDKDKCLNFVIDTEETQLAFALAFIDFFDTENGPGELQEFLNGFDIDTLIIEWGNS